MACFFFFFFLLFLLLGSYYATTKPKKSTFLPGVTQQPSYINGAVVGIQGVWDLSIVLQTGRHGRGVISSVSRLAGARDSVL